MKALGEHPRIEDGGVSWEGDARSMMRANLWLRAASRVLVRVAKFEATAFYELEQRAKRIAWTEFLGTQRRPAFRVTARKSKLYHTDAIAERLTEAAGGRRSGASLQKPVRGMRPGGSKHKPQTTHQDSHQLFVVRVSHDHFTISADTSGDLLHVRGYRQAVGKAPLRETLAAALLLASDWSGDAALIDPFCGSGTIPIEAALIARRIAPGLAHRFAFMDWPSHNAADWTGLVEEAETRALASSPVAIRGSDRDAGAIESARANALRAGVALDIEWSIRAVSAIQAPSATGLVATNPPYGARISKRADLRNLYARFGQVLRREFGAWRVALYSADSRLAAETSLAFVPMFRTSHGGIRVSAVVAEVPAGHGIAGA